MLRLLVVERLLGLWGRVLMQSSGGAYYPRGLSRLAFGATGVCAGAIMTLDSDDRYGVWLVGEHHDVAAAFNGA